MEEKLKLESIAKTDELFGPADSYLRMVRETFRVKISARDGEVTIAGDDRDVKRAIQVIGKMQSSLRKRSRLSREDVNGIIIQVRKEVENLKGKFIKVFSPKEIIEPFTDGQVEYIKAMEKNDLVFCTGPAGTGKTYLAVAMAVSMLKRREIRKIVLVRPAVEAGERLGFLPGDIEAKVNPYLRPLFDSLEDMMEFTQMRRFMEMDIIEVIPLAFMRGRTLNEAVVICDEAQNTTPSQMLMFLTRLGRSSKMIVTGDLTQVDLGKGDLSGMLDAYNALQGINNIGFVSLKQQDIVRHTLVQNIVEAYEKRKKME